MGACNIDFEVRGKADIAEVKRAFQKQVEYDRACNGHQEGYSGDFQTVSRVVFHTDTIFETYQIAYDYCLDNAEKWETVIAVQYKHEGIIGWLVAGWGAC